MKKVIFLICLSLLFLGCTPNDAQIEAAIEKTRIAQPTNTEISQPTNKPTIDPSPTPNIRHIDGLSYDDVVTMFLISGIVCVDREINEDGSYSQECNGVLLNGLIQGVIKGESPETVYAYSVTYIPFIGEDLYDEMEETFYNFIAFGAHTGEMKTWLDDNIQNVLKSETLNVEYLELSNYAVVLTGGTELGSIDIVANPD